MSKFPDKTDKQDSQEESGLARWSRRKAAARGDAIDNARLTATSDDSISEPPKAPVNEPVETLTDADMPPLESLDEHSDYSAFLSPGVSEKLRKLALRKLFHLDVYNFSDGLDDYAEDYTKFAPLGNILTSDMRLAQERAAKVLREQSLTDEANTDDEVIEAESISDYRDQSDEDEIRSSTSGPETTRLADGEDAEIRN